MPNDSTYYLTLDTSQYQILNTNTIKGNRSIILLLNSEKDQGEKIFYLPIEVVFTSVFVPICAFLLGLFITRFREKWKEISNAKAHEEYFLTWIGLICDRVKKQSESIKEFATEMLDINKSPHYKTFNFHIDKIKEVSSVELHKALVLSKKGNRKELENLYYKALNAIEFFQRKYTECLEFVNRYREMQKQINTELTSGLQELNTLRLKYIAEKKLDVAGDPFLYQFYKIHEAFKLKEETKTTLFQYYLYPINQLCNKYLNATPDDQRVLEVTNITNKLLFSHSLFKKACIKNSSSFIERHHQLEKSVNDLLEATESLRKIKFNSALF